MIESELSKNLRKPLSSIGGQAKLRLDNSTVFRDAEKLRFSEELQTIPEHLLAGRKSSAFPKICVKRLAATPPSYKLSPIYFLMVDQKWLIRQKLSGPLLSTRKSVFQRIFHKPGPDRILMDIFHLLPESALAKYLQRIRVMLPH